MQNYHRQLSLPLVSSFGHLQKTVAYYTSFATRPFSSLPSSASLQPLIQIFKFPQLALNKPRPPVQMLTYSLTRCSPMMPAQIKGALISERGHLMNSTNSSSQISLVLAFKGTSVIRREDHAGSGKITTTKVAAVMERAVGQRHSTSTHLFDRYQRRMTPSPW